MSRVFSKWVLMQFRYPVLQGRHQKIVDLKYPVCQTIDTKMILKHEYNFTPPPPPPKKKKKKFDRGQPARTAQAHLGRYFFSFSVALEPRFSLGPFCKETNNEAVRLTTLYKTFSF